MARPLVTPDPWAALRAHTPARIALGRSGVSLPTSEWLKFSQAHAEARDAVHVPLDADRLVEDLSALGLSPLQVHSAATDRSHYLLRPDLGRQLDEASSSLLARQPATGCELLLVLGDGLSSAAVQRHAVPLVAEVMKRLPAGWRLGPPVIALQARVALGDPIGERLGAQMVAVLIGERPGLSSPDSLGVYLTHAPRPGRSDAERNCISNIRPEGLAVDAAARKLVWLASEGLRLRLTGVGLKDRSDERALEDDTPHG
jgi:ethanolamine ammonia-lyase small subunit